MERLLETYYFGAHRADVVRHVNGTTTYLVLVDGVIASDPPLEAPPRGKDVERIVFRSLARAQAPSSQPTKARPAA